MDNYRTMRNVYKIADNILSPLGNGTEENYQAMLSGRSALARYERHWDMPEPFCASLFSPAADHEYAIEGLTRFESLVVRSVRQALEGVDIDVSGSNLVFILSTTKANVGLLGRETSDPDLLYPGESALHICQALGITTPPIVVCNACISGVSAIILGSRLLRTHQYDYAIVCGADEMNEFVVSGFQSLKALSDQPCKPFDMERTGLNLGEAAATMILSTHRGDSGAIWRIDRCSMHNDAYHISAPSKRGDGAYLCLSDVVTGIPHEEIAFVNAHGTATLFNDQMESVAIERAGLQEKPVNALKGYFGHTLGAAGVLETLLSMYSIDHHTLLGTRGFEELGVSGKIHIQSEHEPIDQPRFVKMISGFGGSNAALTASRENAELGVPSNEPSSIRPEWTTTHCVYISTQGIRIDNEPLHSERTGADLLTSLYKEEVGDYPKFYKMDMLSRLGFLAAELLAKKEREGQEEQDEQRAIVLFNHSSSLHTDRLYLDTIKDKSDYFPSPSLFVYTLPNIVTGEIAIRHHYQGETSFYILAERDERLMDQVVRATLCTTSTASMMTGWLDYDDADHFEAELRIIRKTN